MITLNDDLQEISHDNAYFSIVFKYVY